MAKNWLKKWSDVISEGHQQRSQKETRVKSQVVPLDDAAKRLLPLDFPASALGLVDLIRYLSENFPLQKILC